MFYYLFMAIVDIGLYISDHWKDLTFTAAASAIGIILGKRLGIRFAVNYFTKTLGIQHKPTLERKVDWLIEQERKRGNVWIAPTSKPYKLNIRRVLLKRSILSRMVRSIVLYTKLHMRWRKKKMTKDILSGKKKIGVLIIAVLINGLNDVFGLGLTAQTLDTATYIGGGYVAIEGVLDIIRSFSNHFLKKQEIQTTAASEERSH